MDGDTTEALADTSMDDTNTPDVDEGAEALADTAEGAENADAQEGDDPNPDMHTVKVDGEEIQLTLDELKAGYSRAAAATRRFQEAAQQKREIQEFVGRLKSGDRQTIVDLFGKIGVDFTRLAEEHLSEYLQDLDAPEHVRGMRDLERKRAEFERQQQDAQTRAQEAQIEREADRERERYTSDVTSALSKAGLPASQPIIAKVARELEMALTHGYELSTADAVQIVAEEMRLLLRKLPPDAAARLMGGTAAVEQAQRADAAKVAAQQRQRAAQVARRPQRGTAAAKPVNPENMQDVKALFDS